MNFFNIKNIFCLPDINLKDFIIFVTFLMFSYKVYV